MSRKKERKPILEKEELKDEVLNVEPTVEKEKKERHEKKKRRKQDHVHNLTERSVSSGMLSSSSNESAAELAIDPMRRLVAQELLDTERTYVNQLGSLINVRIYFLFTLSQVRSENYLP